MEASDWTYTQIPSRIEQVGLRVQLQLTVEQFDLFVGLGDVVFDKLFHVCSNGDARETAARSRSHVFPHSLNVLDVCLTTGMLILFCAGLLNVDTQPRQHSLIQMRAKGALIIHYHCFDWVKNIRYTVYMCVQQLI